MLYRVNDFFSPLLQVSTRSTLLHCRYCVRCLW